MTSSENVFGRTRRQRTQSSGRRPEIRRARPKRSHRPEGPKEAPQTGSGHARITEPPREARKIIPPTNVKTRAILESEPAAEETGLTLNEPLMAELGLSRETKDSLRCACTEDSSKIEMVNTYLEALRSEKPEEREEAIRKNLFPFLGRETPDEGLEFVAFGDFETPATAAIPEAAQPQPITRFVHQGGDVIAQTTPTAPVTKNITLAQMIENGKIADVVEFLNGLEQAPRQERLTVLKGLLDKAAFQELTTYLQKGISPDLLRTIFEEEFEPEGSQPLAMEEEPTEVFIEAELPPHVKLDVPDPSEVVILPSAEFSAEQPTPTPIDVTPAGVGPTAADFEVEVVAVPKKRDPRATTLATVLAERTPFFRLPRNQKPMRREKPAAAEAAAPAAETAAPKSPLEELESFLAPLGKGHKTLAAKLSAIAEESKTPLTIITSPIKHLAELSQTTAITIQLIEAVVDTNTVSPLSDRLKILYFAKKEGWQDSWIIGILKKAGENHKLRFEEMGGGLTQAIAYTSTNWSINATATGTKPDGAGQSRLVMFGEKFKAQLKTRMGELVRWFAL